MLRFDWNALRIGDKVLVHDAWGKDFTLMPGVVVTVEAQAGKRGVNHVGIRVVARDGQHVVWPPYLAVHRDPLERPTSCWRCDEVEQRLALAS